MITLETLNGWLISDQENERLEFKEAKNSFDLKRLLHYCVAISNEKGGHLVLGVSDKLPRKIVGTHACLNIGDIKSKILNKLHFRVEIYELLHTDGRVLVFDIPSRPTGQPHQLDGAYWMRSGEELVPMTPDQLKRIFSETDSSWFIEPAKENVNADEVVSLLDTQIYFDSLKSPYPTTRDGVLDRLTKDGLIRAQNGSWIISNLAAILLAKRLDAFSPALARKAPRVVIYKGIDKLITQDETTGTKGYVVAFEGLLEFVHSAAPQNHFVEQVVREEVKMFPKQALRELIANALVHQDFSKTGTSVMIEMYSDRIEISNPGKPPIETDRFIDENLSRNEVLTTIMRRLGICEEKGSGIDKVVKAAEIFQLPAPDFRVGEVHTTVVLFAHQEFSKMNMKDRIRACFQHCVLLYVSNQRMSNQSLRERFRLPESSAPIVSLVIANTKEARLIKPDDGANTNSSRYARYLPYWA
jgi:ATP-dependent DNA helicase RecG